jgi:hypothetical protein
VANKTPKDIDKNHIIATDPEPGTLNHAQTRDVGPSYYALLSAGISGGFSL